MISSFIAGSVLIAPWAAYAQFTGVPTAESAADPFSLSVSPDYPTPYSVVTVTPVSGALSVTGATMVVSANGKETARGNAGPSAVALGAPGVPVTVSVRLADASGAYTKKVTLTPEDVALVLEPLSSAPPLYLGKALIPQNGSVRAVAVADFRTPSGKRLDPSTLSYRWMMDGDILLASSGVGKKTVVVNSPLPYHTTTVSVVVSSPDGTLASGASTDLSSFDPIVRIYRRDPLLGPEFDHAIGSSYTLGGSEITLYAAAFSFPTDSGAPSLIWALNGSNAQFGPFITLRPTGAGAGTASVSVSASSGGGVSASANLLVSFGAKGGGGLFGL